jgi:hypothetical protein
MTGAIRDRDGVFREVSEQADRRELEAREADELAAPPKQRRGFALLSDEQRTEVSRLGGLRRRNPYRFTDADRARAVAARREKGLP